MVCGCVSFFPYLNGGVAVYLSFPYLNGGDS